MTDFTVSYSYVSNSIKKMLVGREGRNHLQKLSISQAFALISQSEILIVTHVPA